jgi:hypothetical protein
MQKHTFGFITFTVIGILVLSACKAATKTPTPTVENLDAISTSLAQTAFFQLTQLSLTQPATPVSTNTPLPSPTSSTSTPFPTLAPPVSGNCASSKFITDVTIPDGTLMYIGQVFKKTWRVQNIGTCPWTTSFKLTYKSGEAMGGQAVTLAETVAVGNQVDLSVTLTVPNKTGKLTGVWVLVDGNGQQFGITLTVVINVSTASPTPTRTGSRTATPTGSRTVTRTKTPTSPSGSTPTSTPTPSHTPVVTNSPTSPLPTETPTATEMPSPTNTLPPPTDTSIPPTDTSPAPTETPTPSNTPV